MIWLILSIKFSLDIVEHMITISNEFKHVNMFGKNSFYVKMEYVQNVEILSTLNDMESKHINLWHSGERIIACNYHILCKPNDKRKFRK